MIPFFNPFKDMTEELGLLHLGIIVNSKQLRIPLRSRVNLEILLMRFGGSLPSRTDYPDDSAFNVAMRRWFESVIQLFSIEELQLYPSGDNKAFREAMTDEVLFSGILGSTGTATEDVYFTDRFPPVQTRAENRQRTRQVVPIAACIFILCTILAASPDLRGKLNNFAAQGRTAPSILQELMNANRRSFCGGFRLEPQVQGLSPNVQAAFLLSNTIFDVTYLQSDNGIEAVFALFARLANYPGNYIPFITLKPVEMESNFMSMVCALHNEPLNWGPASVPVVRTQTRVLQTLSSKTLLGDTKTNVPIPGYIPPSTSETLIRVLPGHSYGEKVNAVHALDAYLWSRTLIGDDGNPIYIGEYSASCDFTSGTQNYAMYVIKRGTGVMKNSLKPTPPPTIIDGDASTPVVDTPPSPPSEEKPTKPAQADTPPRGGRGRGNGRGRNDQGRGRGRGSVRTGALPALSKLLNLHEAGFIKTTTLNRVLLACYD